MVCNLWFLLMSYCGCIVFSLGAYFIIYLIYINGHLYKSCYYRHASSECPLYACGTSVAKLCSYEVEESVYKWLFEVFPHFLRKGCFQCAVPKPCMTIPIFP